MCVFCSAINFEQFGVLKLAVATLVSAQKGPEKDRTFGDSWEVNSNLAFAKFTMENPEKPTASLVGLGI